MSWPTSRWLTSDFLLRVHELDRVLDRHDVVGARAVDEVDERGERRRLAGTGRAGDEHETTRAAARTGRRLRDAELAELLDLGRDETERRTDGAALLVEVDAETGVRREREREVELELARRTAAFCSASGCSESAEATLSLVPGRLPGDGRERAVDADHRRRVRR